MVLRVCMHLYTNHYKINKIANLIFRNVSKSSILRNCSSNNTSNTDDTKKRLSDSDANNSTGYLEMLAKDMKSNENIEANNNITKVQNELIQSVNSTFSEIDSLNDSFEDVSEKLLGPFDHCDKDLSNIGPNITPTYNFAKYANRSNTIQQLVHLGVELYKLERNTEILQMFLALDFDRDLKPYIRLLHDAGVKPENLGYFITRNPMIFKENMDDLLTRIRYLRAHKFDTDMIQKILNTHPPWLSFKAEQLDYRLGYFQHTFKLTGKEVRHICVRCPKVITYSMKHININSFAVKKQMGFNTFQTKFIFMNSPRVWIRATVEIVKSFDYLHNHMKLSHDIIQQNPQSLLCRRSRLERRHLFLVELKRDQYDPNKPLYVSLISLITGSDTEFCDQIAKTPVHVYNEFMKTL